MADIISHICCDTPMSYQLPPLNLSKMAFSCKDDDDVYYHLINLGFDENVAKIFRSYFGSFGFESIKII